MSFIEKKAVLPVSVVRLLQDRSYEKRKEGAMELDAHVKQLLAAQKKPCQAVFQDQLVEIIRQIVKKFAQSSQANHRKGALIALAGIAIALLQDAADYLELLIPPALKMFDDSDSSVRYYACECLYNISKVCRNAVLVYFNQIFDGLCKLYADPDMEVKNGAELLSSLLKDIVCEAGHNPPTFDLESWIPLLSERIKIHDPYIRNLIIGWVTLLDSVPEIPVLDYIPEYLAGLFEMLGDSNKDIIQQVTRALADFLASIKASPYLDVSPMVPILVDFCDIKRLDSNLARVTALSWLLEFIIIGGDALLPLLADMLGAAITSLPDKDKDLRVKAEACNDALLQLVAKTQMEIDCESLLQKVTYHLLSKFVDARLAALRWILMIQNKMPQQIILRLTKLLPTFLKTLHDSNDQVVRKDIEVLARICYAKDKHELDEVNFPLILNHLVGCFSQDRRLLDKRGRLIVRQLCLLLDGEAIYRTLALTLRTQEPSFAALMVQTLNLILFTSPELYMLRNAVKNSLATPKGRDLFGCLYKTWCHNPVATFSLCLFAQAYQLATALVYQVAELEMTVPLLMQLDKLVQLVESPIFLHLRLQLLEPHRYPFLFKALYGMLMLLPQSPTFGSMKHRLASVADMAGLAQQQEDIKTDSRNASKRATPEKARERKSKNSRKKRTKSESKENAWFGSDVTGGAEGQGGASWASPGREQAVLDVVALLEEFRLTQLQHAPPPSHEGYLHYSLLHVQPSPEASPEPSAEGERVDGASKPKDPAISTTNLAGCASPTAASHSFVIHRPQQYRTSGPGTEGTALVGELGGELGEVGMSDGGNMSGLSGTGEAGVSSVDGYVGDDYFSSSGTGMAGEGARVHMNSAIGGRGSGAEHSGARAGRAEGSDNWGGAPAGRCPKTRGGASRQRGGVSSRRSSVASRGGSRPGAGKGSSRVSTTQPADKSNLSKGKRDASRYR
eukprot:g32424.t1